MSESDKAAEIHVFESDFGDHYSINLKDENGKVVSTQVMKDLNEARRVKEKWESGSYTLLTEIEPKNSMI